jgi:hypothetical protein
MDCNIEKESLAQFVKQIIHMTLGLSEQTSKVEVITLTEAKERYKDIDFRHQIIVLISTNIDDASVDKLSHFVRKSVSRIDPTTIYWGEGDSVDSTRIHALQQSTQNITSSSSALPQWLDELLFDKLGARHQPNHSRFEYNLDLDKDEVLVYLGTYFPRSYRESIVLFEKLLFQTDFGKSWNHKKTIRLLDLGCGSGGEIIGFLTFVEQHMPNVESIEVLAIDGNQNALRLFEKVITVYKNQSRLQIKHNVFPCIVGNKDELYEIVSLISNEYDVILSFKAICELVQKRRIEENAYAYCLEMLMPLLASEGVLLLVDVTIKNETVNKFLPYYIGEGVGSFVRRTGGRYSTILPFICRSREHRCRSGCFYREVVNVSHSRKRNEISKVVYRFLGHSDYVKSLKALATTDTTEIQCKH